MQRWLFRRELEDLADVPIFYLDECGVDHRLDRAYARAPRGERIYRKCPARGGTEPQHHFSQPTPEVGFDRNESFGLYSVRKLNYSYRLQCPRFV